VHPAYSVIFFTTASGAGYGMLALFGLAAALGSLPAERDFAVAGSALAFALVVSGLLSSTLHLGHPERAWRALSQWRSSWLSREGVLAVFTFLPAGLFAFGWAVLGETDGVFAFAGVINAAACALTVYTTSMIYGSLRSVRAWSDPWVTPAYLVLSFATGAVLANALAHAFAVDIELGGTVVASLIGAAIVKSRYWRSIDARGSDSTPETATGLGHLGKVRLLEPPHTGTNYLMSEMGYRIARKHAQKLRRICLLCGIAAPLVLTGAAMAAAGAAAVVAAVLAAASAAVGVVIERWLFFAEAKHAVTLYYGRDEA
jgi:DMSO reductase anchor subunit